MITKSSEKVLQIMNEFLKLDKGIPAIRAQIFMVIAKREAESSGGLLVTDLMDILEQPQATVWRHVAILGQLSGIRKTGAGLVETVPDTVDPRRNKIYLTPKGREFLANIDAIITGDERDEVDETIESR